MRDRLLALALEEHEAGLHSCGHPRSIAWSPLAEGEYDVAVATCQACAGMDRWHRAERRKAGQDTSSENAAADGRVVMLLPPPDPGGIRPWDGQVATTPT